MNEVKEILEITLPDGSNAVAYILTDRERVLKNFANKKGYAREQITHKKITAKRAKEIKDAKNAETRAAHGIE